MPLLKGFLLYISILSNKITCVPSKIILISYVLLAPRVIHKKNPYISLNGTQRMSINFNGTQGIFPCIKDPNIFSSCFLYVCISRTLKYHVYNLILLHCLKYKNEYRRGVSLYK